MVTHLFVSHSFFFFLNVHGFGKLEICQIVFLGSSAAPVTPHADTAKFILVPEIILGHHLVNRSHYLKT